MTNIETVLCPSLFKNIYLFVTVLGLCCWVGLSLVVASRGSSPFAVCGLLITAASLLWALGMWAW